MRLKHGPTNSEFILPLPYPLAFPFNFADFTSPGAEIHFSHKRHSLRILVIMQLSRQTWNVLSLREAWRAH